MQTAKSKAKISLVIPVFNEEGCLPELIQRCLAVGDSLKHTYEILFVDDGSSDRSSALIEAAAAQHSGKIIGVFLNRNYGQHAAVIAGLGQTSGDIIVTLDADLQNPPEEIPLLIAAMERGFDVVGSVREQRRDPGLRKIASWTINKIAQSVTGIKMHDYGCMLRAYRRPIVDAILKCQERSTFIPILANSFAHRVTEIKVRHEARVNGHSKYNLWKLINLQFDLLTSMTTFPLRLLSVLGAIISIFGIGFGMILLVLRLIHGPAWAAEGVFTLFAILFVFIGAQFIGMGLLGEYLGRVYHDVRARPRYWVDRVVGHSALAPPAPQPSPVNNIYERICV